MKRHARSDRFFVYIRGCRHADYSTLCSMKKKFTGGVAAVGVFVTLRLGNSTVTLLLGKTIAPSHSNMTCRTFLLVVALLCTLFATSISARQAGYVCKTKDCSDVVGEALVQDMKGSRRRDHEEQFHEHKEHSRQRRVEIQRREKRSE